MDAFFSRLQSVADVLAGTQDDGFAARIQTVRQGFNTPRLRMLIIGERYSGRKTIASHILGTPDLLPQFILTHSDIPFLVESGASNLAEIVHTSGLRTIGPLAALKKTLMDDISGESFTEVRIQSDNPWLKLCQIRIEDLNPTKDEAYWKPVLAETDFVLLVLQADRLLSQIERDFMRDILVPFYGLGQVALVINRVDLLRNVRDRDDLYARIDQFLGTLSAVPLVLAVSCMSEEYTLVDTADRAALVSLIQNDLLAHQGPTKMEAIRQALVVILADMERTTRSQAALQHASADDCAAAIRVLEDQQEWLQSRIRRAQTRVDLYIETLLKEELFREVETFSETLRQNLPAEISSVKDAQVIRQLLPSYLEQVWNEFFEILLPVTRQKIQEEINQLSAILEKDIHAYSRNALTKLGVVKDDFTMGQAMAPFIPAGQTKSNLSSTATALQAGGLGSIVLLGNLPLGVAALGIGQIVRAVAAPSIYAAQIRAITEQALEITYDLEGQVKESLKRSFTQTGTQVKETVAHAYDQESRRVRSQIEQASTNAQENQSRGAQLQSLLDADLPNLKAALEALIH
jgi:hypothetical protein